MCDYFFRLVDMWGMFAIGKLDARDRAADLRFNCVKLFQGAVLIVNPLDQ